MASRKLRQYLLANSIVVRKDLPLKQVLYIPGLAGRLTKWTIELSEFEIFFEARKTLKAQVFKDFLAKITHIHLELDRVWVVFTNESSTIWGVALM